MSESVDFLSPVGRLVQGDCFVPNTTDMQGNPLTTKTGKNAGKPRVDYFFAIAIEKTDPGWPAFWQKIVDVARAGFPHLFDGAGQCTNPDFAFKVTDGDSAKVNTRGVAPNTREGFPRHYVVNFSSSNAPKCAKANGAGQWVPFTDPEQLKRGYYVRVGGSVVSNDNAQNPGVYMNHSQVELMGYGPPIFTGPTPDQLFGGTPAAHIPAGMSATPVAPVAAAPAAPVAPGAAAAPVAPPVAVTPPAAPVAAPAIAPPAMPQAPAVAAPIAPAPAAGVQPHPGFLNPPAGAVAPVAPVAPAPPVAVTYQTPDGGTFTEAELLGAGWQAAAIHALPHS